MTRLTAPATNKVWSIQYRDNGQRQTVWAPPGVIAGSGMYTAYTYDNRNRLTKIHHEDTSSLSSSGWVYRLDGNGNILRTESSVTGNGEAWDYAYDGRHLSLPKTRAPFLPNT